MVSYLAGLGPVHLLTQMPGNIGDSLIHEGARMVLAASAVAITEVPVGEIPTIDAPDGTLVIPGSGAFDRDWCEWLPDLVSTAAGRFARVVIMPSSFDLSVPAVRDCLRPSNVLPFAREARSFAALRSTGRAALSMDTALYVDAPPADPRVSRRGTLLALREDRSSMLAQSGLVPDAERNCDISLWARDLTDWWERIASADRVVTDRLHVAVAAILAGAKLDYVDPRGQKVSTYLRFALPDGGLPGVTRVDVEWLVDQGWVVRR